MTVINDSIKNSVIYGIEMKYKDFAKMFQLPYKTGGARTQQIKNLRRLYDIKIEKTLYTIIREYDENDVESRATRRMPSNFKVLKKDRHRAGIYKIQLGSVVYIGQTNKLSRRYSSHKNGQNQCDTKSLLLNGGTFEVLEFEDDLEARYLKENKYIEKYELLGYSLLNSKDVLYYGKNKINSSKSPLKVKVKKQNNKNIPKYEKKKIISKSMKVVKNKEYKASVIFDESDLGNVVRLLSDNNIEFKQHKFRRRNNNTPHITY